ncbi:MAG TPA: ElyC/SanA/YdcF family protein [Nitrosopumilaceae archaeon]|jgi:SanA protein|nr:ElyC/SanA/YdcF family protein [Nitrosopumilaceae archaeon]
MVKNLITFLSKYYLRIKKTAEKIRLLRVLTYTILFSLLFIFLSNKWINSTTEKQLFSDTKEIPQNEVGLLLGARPGNIFYNYRIKAATELFKSGKIRHIIVSGDNHTQEYDEGTAMRNDLIQSGVPDSCISIDYAGFRTLDSVIRCWKIFGQKKFTIISQKFHNQRALFIANKNGYDCVAFNAKDVPSGISSSTYFREYFARAKCVLDIYLFHTQPKFLGKKVIINS